MPSRGTIMVIDDDEDILEFIRTALETEAYDVVTATNGWAAFAELGDVAPSLILLDIRMPEMTGWEFADLYRRLPGPPVPIAIITAGPTNFESADLVQVDGYLTKPFSIEDLLRMVEQKARPRSGGRAPQARAHEKATIIEFPRKRRGT